MRTPFWSACKPMWYKHIRKCEQDVFAKRSFGFRAVQMEGHASFQESWGASCDWSQTEQGRTGA